MKKRIHLFLPVLAGFLFVACSNRPAQDELTDQAYRQYLEKGNTLSGQAQAALISNVSNAMKEGGTLHAVEFCNLRASGITDSLNNACSCTIARVSDKNRNPGNSLADGQESQLWNYFRAINDTHMIHDTVVLEGSKAIYYKPILVGMPACLQCHGPVGEIDPPTYSKIRELYPGDKATDYALNDLRGMWKIEFQHEKEEEN